MDRPVGADDAELGRTECEVATNLVDEPTVGVVVATSGRPPIASGTKRQPGSSRSSSRQPVSPSSPPIPTAWSRIGTVPPTPSTDGPQTRAVGRPIIELLPPTTDRLSQAREARARRNAGLTWTGEISVTRKDGTTIPLLVTNTPLVDDDGRPSARSRSRRTSPNAIAIRKTPRCSRRSSTPRTMRSSRDARRGDHELERGRREAVRLHGRGDRGPSRRNPDRADRRHEADEIQNRIRTGGSVKDLDTVRVRADGSPIHVSISVSPIRDGNGSIIGASTIARDITERVELTRRHDDDRAGSPRPNARPISVRSKRDLRAETLGIQRRVCTRSSAWIPAPRSRRRVTGTPSTPRTAPRSSSGSRRRCGPDGAGRSPIASHAPTARSVGPRTFGFVAGRTDPRGTVFDITDHRKAGARIDSSHITIRSPTCPIGPGS